MRATEESEIKISIPLRQANKYSFALFFACLLVFGALFSLFYSWATFIAGWSDFLMNYTGLAIAVIGGMAAHEFLHALTWASFCKEGFKSISFGINWKHMAPYVHCREFLQRNQYAWGASMPGLLLGFVPLIISLFTGSGWLLCFGTFFTAGAAGDITCVARLLRFKKNDMVLDDPDDLGFIVRPRS